MVVLNGWYRCTWTCLAIALGAMSGLQAVVYGSDTVFSRQSAVTFPAADSNNTMLGFAAFENGFTLADNATTCSFSDFLPVSGVMDLNSGSLWLNEDFITANRFLWRNPGRVFGNNNAIMLPPQRDPFVLPALSAPFLITTLDSEMLNAATLSVDWSYNNQYVGGVSQNSSGAQECILYYFDGAVLTATQSIELTRQTNSLRWHPTQNDFAIGRNGISSNEVIVYRFNIYNGTSTVRSGLNFGSSNATALAWHPSGGYLLAGNNQSTNQLVCVPYNKTTGALGTAMNATLSPNRAVSRDALSWSIDGAYVAVGTALNSSAGGDELLVCSFNETTLTVTARFNVALEVSAVDWCPTGSYIAVGLKSGTSNIRVYEHKVATQTLEEKLTARVAESKNVGSMHWNQTGDYLMVGFTSGLSSEVRIYSFDKTALTLTLLNSVSLATDVNSVRWAHNDDYILRGQTGKEVVVSRLDKPISFFSNATLVMNSDVVAAGDMQFHGFCKIDGMGRTLTINPSISLMVRPGSTLVLDNVVLKGVKDSSLLCMTDNGQCTLRNSELVLSGDYTFSRGALLCERDVVISGSSRFVYSAVRTSTIASLSSLTFDFGTTFSYAPRVGKKNLLSFADSTATLFLNGCQLVSTRTGLTLSGGQLLFDNDVTISSQARGPAEAITLLNDLNVRVLSSANVSLFGLVRVS